ncbi:hypothetical protein Tco_0206554 [Tanacetum coccineum]
MNRVAKTIGLMDIIDKINDPQSELLLLLSCTGISLFFVSKPCSACSRVFAGDIYGDHVVSCVVIIGIKHRHNVVRDTLVDICYRSGISAGKEIDIGLDGERDKPLLIDVARCKCGKYMAKCAAIGYGLLPFFFSSLGELEADAVTLLKRIRKFSMNQDIRERAAAHIFNRISFAIAKGVLGGNYSSTEQVNSIQQLLAYSLITGTEVDIGEIIYSDLVTKLLNKSRQKYVSYPRFISCALQVLLGCDYTQDVKFGFLPGILSNSNFTKDLSKVPNIELTAHMIAVNNQKDLVSPLPFSGKKKKVKSQTVTPTIPKS